MSNATPIAVEEKVPAMSTLRWLAGHWQPHRGQLPLLLLLTFANAAVLVSYPFLLKQIVDAVTQEASHAVLVRSVLLLVVVGVSRFGIYTAMQTLRTRLNMQFEFGVRVRAFDSLLRQGPRFFRKYRTGDLVTRLMDDVSDKLSWYMCSGILRVIEAAAIIVFGLAMMLSISPELTLYSAGPLPILVTLFMVTASRLHERYEIVQQTISRLNDSLETCFSGIRVVKAFAAEPLQQQKVEEAVDQQRAAEIRAVRWQTVIDSLYGNVWQLAVVGVLIVGGGMVMEGRLTLGDVVAFDAYVLLLVWPMFDIGQFLVRGRLSAVSIGRIDELESAIPCIAEPDLPAIRTRTPDDPDADDLPAPKLGRAPRTVRFEHVRYSYPDVAEPVLEDVTFEAAAGKVTAIAGAIGSGKSTLISLVGRLVDPTEGKVTINGQPLFDVPLIAYRQRIGFVPQEPVLLSGTIEENIRFGRKWISDEQFHRAASVAQLESDIKELPDGLQTVVGARGLRLSVGQKQRVAVARALADEPDILLLDDCTASLDMKTEQHLWEALFRDYPLCTTLVVTHRPSTLRRAQHIVVLDRGRVTEAGMFGELNQPGTLFHDLYVRWELEERVEG